MSLEQPNIIEAFKARHGDQLTPFHIRVQLWTLLFGPGSLKQKIKMLLTESKSPWHIRERFVAMLRNEAISLASTLIGEGLLEETSLDQGSITQVNPEINLDKVIEEIELTIENVCHALDVMGKKNLHIGLIADGNRRYGDLEGEKHGIAEEKRKSWGHIQGAKAIEKIFLPLIAQTPNITECSLYLLSHDNLLKRPEKELKALNQLFNIEKKKLLKLAKKHNIRYHHAGDMKDLEKKMSKIVQNPEEPLISQGLQELVDATKNNNGLVVNLCVNYQAKTELATSAKKWAVELLESGATKEEIMALDNVKISENLRREAWIKEKMDLCIRTGADHRISGFPPNQVWNENCELTVLKKFLPQITPQDILRVLMAFSGVEQRNGG